MWTIAALACLFGIPLPAVGADGWQAGTARAVITPRESMWMAGYGSRDHPSEGVQHDLWAKALALRDPGGKTALLVTLDVCGIDRELSNSIRDRLEERHGLDRSRIVLACSHTHSGPVVKTNLGDMYPLDDEQRRRVDLYSDGLAGTVVAIAGQAIERLAPASLAWGTGQCDFAVNRRNNDQAKADELRRAIALQGPVDHDVPVLRLGAADGSPLAVVFGYACHCTTLQGYQFSGDYAGFAQIALERDVPGAQAMYFAGCGGDQNPLPRGTVEQAARYGDQLAASVRQVLSGPMRPIAGELGADYREIDLALGPIPDRARWEEETKSTTLATRNRARRMLATLDAGGTIPTTYPYNVQAWRLGDGPCWFFLGGEVTVDYALRLKRNLGSSRTWVAAYCNDVMAYIPSLRVLREGGYEGGGAMVYYGLPAPWSEGVEDQVIEAVRGAWEAVEKSPAADDAEGRR
jgi:hypothetical protein